MSFDIAPGRPSDKYGAGKPDAAKPDAAKPGPHQSGRDERPIFDEHPVAEPAGFGQQGFRKQGFRKQGFRKQGFRKQGFRKQGFRKQGFLRQGPAPISRDVLSRYLLTRALGSSVRGALQWTGVAVLVLAVLCWLGGLKVLGVLIGLVALGILGVRALFSAVSRRLSGAALLGENVTRVDRLVGQTRRGLRHELHRVGLPGAPWGPLLILKRLISRRRRAETLAKLSQIDLAAVVPQSRVDELYLVLGARP